MSSKGSDTDSDTDAACAAEAINLQVILSEPAAKNHDHGGCGFQT